MKTIKTASLALVTFTFFIFHCFGADAKPLTKAQAAQIFQLMGYQAVEVGAIVQQSGVHEMGEFGAQNVAKVIAIGAQDGKTYKLEKQFHYDSEAGWFCYEFDGTGTPGMGYTPTTKLRMWTLSGYRELRPKLTDSSATEKIIGSWKHDSGMVLNYTKDGRWLQTLEKRVLRGTWKIEQGVLNSTTLTSTPEPVPAENITRWEILRLEQATLVLKGTAGEMILSRKLDQ